MAISTIGGSGTVEVSTSDQYDIVTTLFTTPSTANTMYIVTWTYVPQNGPAEADVSHPSDKVNANTPALSVRGGTIRTGPSADVTVLAHSAGVTAKLWLYSYNYVGITFG